MSDVTDWLEHKRIELAVRAVKTERELRLASKAYLEAAKQLEACDEVLALAREQEALGEVKDEA